MKKLVLLVEDDRLPMQFYVKALDQKGFKVKQFVEPDGALNFVRDKGSQISAIILDIMMPPGRYGPECTNEGLKTGVFLLKDLREKCPNVPVVVLTNVENPKTFEKFQEGPLLRVMQKMDCPPFELVDLLNRMLADGKEKDSNKR